MSLHTGRFSETHRRLYFKDVQAVSVQGDTRARTYTNACIVFFALSVVAGAALLLFLPSGVSDFLASLFFALAAAALFLLFVNFALGPTCTTYVYTAVQREHFSGVGRLSAARKFIARIVPAIEGAQGHVAEESIAKFEEQLQAARPANYAMDDRAGAVDEASKPFDSGLIHLATFGAFAVAGLAFLTELLFTYPGKNIVDSALLITVVILNILALRRQLVFHVSMRLKAFTWIALGMCFLIFFVNSMTIGFSTSANSDELDVLKFFFSPSFPSFGVFATVEGILLILVGLPGLALAANHRAAFVWTLKRSTPQAGNGDMAT